MAAIAAFTVVSLILSFTTLLLFHHSDFIQKLRQFVGWVEARNPTAQLHQMAITTSGGRCPPYINRHLQKRGNRQQATGNRGKELIISVRELILFLIFGDV